MTTMGVSIAVPEPFGEDLRTMRAGFGDPAAATVPSHVTLAPPFELTDQNRGSLTASLQEVASAHQRFTMRLAGSGTFRPVSPVVYITVAEGEQSVRSIAEAVQKLVGRTAANFPFHPHVTVAHHLDDAGLDRALGALVDYEAEFQVESFVLYKHQDPAGWVPTMEFPLG